MENNVSDSGEHTDLSHHEYYLINGLVRKIGAKATRLAETPKRVKKKIVEFIDELNIANGGE